MYMADEEIRTMYRDAKYPKQQIHILAQLNDTTPRYIKGIIGLMPRVPYEKPVYPVETKKVNPVKMDALLNDTSLTFSAIANKLKLSPATVQHYYNRNKHKLAYRKPNAKIDEARLMKYILNPYLTYTEVAEKAHCGLSAVYKYSKKHCDIVPPRLVDKRQKGAV